MSFKMEQAGPQLKIKRSQGEIVVEVTLRSNVDILYHAHGVDPYVSGFQKGIPAIPGGKAPVDIPYLPVLLEDIHPSFFFGYFFDNRMAGSLIPEKAHADAQKKHKEHTAQYSCNPYRPYFFDKELHSAS